MSKQEFYFGKQNDQQKTVVSNETLYSVDTGYGFVTEINRPQIDELMLPELNSGFDVWNWYSGHNLTTIEKDEFGCYISSQHKLPLCFKAAVPKQGNYAITIEINGGKEGINDLMIYLGRRRLYCLEKQITPYETFVFQGIANVCDIIPRGKEEIYEDTTMDITILADQPRVTKITIDSVTVPTIYIAGDSTVTDQPGNYPYEPSQCYNGWAQMLPIYIKDTVAVSNHAHSGLTTESFRSEGHYSIIEKYIQPNDYCFFQFGHNDQKLAHLTADGGYRERLVQYINEIRSKNAIPVIITPLARNTWKGSDGEYNDLLKEYANVCIAIGKEFEVSVLDLHQKSMDFIKKVGLEDGKRYFYPNDYTHTNDFGGYLIAQFVAEEMATYLPFHTLDKETAPVWIPPVKVVAPEPPIGLEYTIPASAAQNITVSYEDLEDCAEKETIIALAKSGILPTEDAAFRPNDAILRVEALSFVSKTANFFPTNVYNDLFEDVIGHEWYAGLVETSWTSGLVDSNLVAKKEFYPLKEETLVGLLSFCIQAYKCRKQLPPVISEIFNNNSDWKKGYMDAAVELKLLCLNEDPDKIVLRKEAAIIIAHLQAIIK